MTLTFKEVLTEGRKKVVINRKDCGLFVLLTPD